MRRYFGTKRWKALALATSMSVAVSGCALFFDDVQQDLAAKRAECRQSYAGVPDAGPLIRDCVENAERWRLNNVGQAAIFLGILAVAAATLYASGGSSNFKGVGQPGGGHAD